MTQVEEDVGARDVGHLNRFDVPVVWLGTSRQMSAPRIVAGDWPATASVTVADGDLTSGQPVGSVEMSMVSVGVESGFDAVSADVQLARGGVTSGRSGSSVRLFGPRWCCTVVEQHDTTIKQEHVESGGAVTSMRVDFRRALRQVSQVEGHEVEVLHRAFAMYVGLFDFADETGRIELSSRALSEGLQLTRTSWTTYRNILIEAGLVEVGDIRGNRPMIVQLLLPTGLV